MIDLSRHIEYLLLHRNDVCVQQLGTFSAKHMASRWVQEEGIFLPPYRTVSYSKQTRAEDDLFLNTLAEKYRLTQQEAQILLAEFVERIEQELEDNGTADLGSIGMFVREHTDGETLFIPNEAGIATPALYGLDAFHFDRLPARTVSINEQKTERKANAKITTDSKYYVIRIHRKAAHYAATMAASVALFFALGTPVANGGMQQLQSAVSEWFMPLRMAFSHKAQPAEATAENSIQTVPAKIVVAPQQEAPVIEEPAAIEETPAEEAPIAEPTPVTEPAPIVRAEGYAAVLASSIPMKRAEEYAQDLQSRGIKAEARQFGKIVRVIIPGFATPEEVHAQIEDLKNVSDEFQQAWTLKLN